MGRPVTQTAFTVGEVYEVEEILDAPVRVKIHDGSTQVVTIHRLDGCSLAGIRRASGETMTVREAIRNHEYPTPCGCLIDARGAAAYVRLYWAKVRDAALGLRR